MSSHKVGASCHACGKALVEGAAFCPFCGTRVPDEESTTRQDSSGDLRRPVDLRPSDIDLPTVPDRYVLGRVVGRGGMGEVWIAYDRLLRRVVALKVLNFGSRERFLDEAKVAAQLEHPSIVPVHDVGKLDDGRVYITMKLLGRRTLQDVLDGIADGSIDVSLKRRLQMFVQVCLALMHAHERRVIHRDLKPKNIMVGEQWETIIVDWGLAKVLPDPAAVTHRPHETKEGELMGTAAYMPPEQALGDVDRLDERSDVYSLGVILFQLLTLRLPFEGDDFKVMTAKIQRAAPAPHEVAPPGVTIPPELDQVCIRALAQDSKDRHPSVKDLAADVQDYLDGVREAERRRSESNLRLQEARRHLERYSELRQLAAESEAAFARIAQDLGGGRTIEERRPVFVAAEALELSRVQREEAFSRVSQALTGALTHDPTHPEARSAFADLYLERMLDAEAAGRTDDVVYLRGQVELYDDGGRRSAILKGDGALELSTTPPDAEVHVLRYVEKDRYLRADQEVLAGRTPLRVDLAMGSYLAVVMKPGFATVRYPFQIRRAAKARGEILLLTPDEVGNESRFVYVPAMEVFLAGDPVVVELTRAETSRPATGHVVATSGFCIARHPVTMAEYVDFLNDLAERDPTEAQSRAPRRAPDGGFYWPRGSDGRFSIPEEPDAEGDRHDPRWPVVGISWNDANEYCAWLSAREDRVYRLPTSFEWEIAARGADSRLFPWGNHFEPSFCNAGGQHRGPVPIDDVKLDESPFGVFGLAGNVSDFCSSFLRPEDKSQVLLRGGSWFPSGISTRAAVLSTARALETLPTTGFRLVHVPDRMSQRT
ncbi:MAG: SUMF1/EgtB/PvdO family nonheme iron enzyme [Acidobacteriota bacterium]